ncbi:16441_t:CDS:2 [Funneliformis geosporum]|uniref:12239_t:CDS:1 n=1 Tax=Funneliformis geosporum TaxID=1117311 RepID=A0A9W4SQN5_9GLOM|nr:16441_t:CDS:2 [Funneliformis geosporum]CAI2178084.1 12239_t:CDS:2 [Funneliformis geosporum]
MTTGMKDNNNKSTIYVGGLDDQVNEQILHAAFIPFGDIVEIQIPPDPASHNQHRGFGFVEFEEACDAQAAIDNMNLSELYGKVVKVNLARPIRIKDGSMRAESQEAQEAQETQGTQVESSTIQMDTSED